MSTSLFSQSWYRVSNIKATLRQHVAIHRHRYRGKLWYVMQDHVTGQFHRFSPEAYQIIGLMDGKRTLQQVWQLACNRLGDDMPTQEDIIQLVSKLNRANALRSDMPPDFDDLGKRQRDIKSKKLLQQLKTPLGVKIPLLDPERFLNAIFGWVRPLMGKAGVAFWLLVVGYGAVMASVHWNPLTQNVQDRLLALENLLLIALIYPVVKVIHELGHAFAVKRWGGEIHEMGIMLLVFIPVPYVDATTASAFRNKYQRMLVGGAGIFVEVFLAAAAMIFWAYAEPGVARSLAFNVMVISGVSTVFFNGNPLLRFDAYYMLSDWLEIPNLGSRGNQYIGYLVKRYIYGIQEVESPANSTSEGIWSGIYAVASFVYRMFIMVAISLFVAGKYFIVGSLFAIWAIYGTVVGPFIKTMAKPMTDQQLKGKKNRTLLFASSVGALLFVLFFIFPLPLATQTEGILWVPEQAFVRASANGFIRQIVAEPGKQVRADDPLIRLEEPGLDAQVKVVAAQLTESRARHQSAQHDRVQSEILREEISFLESEYAHIKERQNKLNLRSERNGVFILPESENLEGRYVTRGSVLGYLVNFERLPVTAVVDADYIDLVRHRTKSVEVRFSSEPETVFQGSIRRIAPSSRRELPSEILATNGGGKIALDTESENQLQTIRNFFTVEIDMASVPSRRIEERAYVLFTHEPEAIYLRIYRAIRRVFLKQFDV